MSQSNTRVGDIRVLAGEACAAAGEDWFEELARLFVEAALLLREDRVEADLRARRLLVRRHGPPCRPC